MLEACHQALLAQKKKLALAESCTGGALSSAFVGLPGASQYLLGSVVAYSNEWKESFLGVKKELLQEYGAVSREVVIAMVEGLFHATSADFAIATSGIAGPSGGTAEKPVGTLWVGWGKRGSLGAELFQGPVEREVFRLFAVKAALGVLWTRLYE